MSKERRYNIIASKQGGSTGITSGVSWDAFDVDGNLTEATAYGNNIPPSAFGNQYQLTSISFVGSITKLPDSAFRGCWSITEYSLPNSILEIGVSTFDSNESLIRLALPPNVVTIGYAAFDYCTGLTRVWIPKSVLYRNLSENPDASYLSWFSNCSPTLTIYCEAASAPVGWGTYWNYYDATNQLSVVWGVSKAAFDALE